MYAVMQRTGMTAYWWATKAGTSPTNITRFLNSDTKFIPSSRTVAKLSAVVRSAPNLGPISDSEKVSVKNVEGDFVEMIALNPHTNDYKLGRITELGEEGINSYCYLIVDEKSKRWSNGDKLAIYDSEKNNCWREAGWTGDIQTKFAIQWKCPKRIQQICIVQVERRWGHRQGHQGHR